MSEINLHKLQELEDLILAVEDLRDEWIKGPLNTHSSQEVSLRVIIAYDKYKEENNDES